ncbi:MAG: hypothetical protein FD174_1264 [Geobacteraceae bacterium]|nr:MAG: hypothetical protein FD174_1264 [Geobacteraceae bacterium]
MKRFAVALLTVVTMGVAGLAVAEEMGKSALKAGDEIYVCNCGEGCQCGSVARKASNCACNKEMAKVKVTKVEEAKAYYMANGKERSVATTGKYACACGSRCDCGYISQKPGKCACGKELKKVE